MKWKTLIGMAVASAFASGGALAGSFHHGTEVQTPMSVNESAPWLALEESGYGPTTMHEPVLADSSVGTMHEQVSLNETAVDTGASSTESASGVGGFDSSLSSTSTEEVDYWRMDQSSDVGSTASFASGSGGFSSSVSSNTLTDETASTEAYIVPAPLAAFDGSNYAWSVDTSDPESIDTLASITDYYVITPIYSDTVDVSAFDQFADASLVSDVDVGSTASSGYGSIGFDSDMSADASSFSEPETIASVTTYYGDNLSLLLDSGFTSDEMEA